MKPGVLRLFNVYSDRYGTNYAGNVWSRNGIAPAILTLRGGDREPMIVEIYEKDSKLYDSGQPARPCGKCPR